MTLNSEMPTIANFIESRLAPTQHALDLGDGCHRDEGTALGAFLGAKITAQQAAASITAPVLREPDPAAAVHRLMGLLCEALVELGADHRTQLLDLLEAIQQLPPSERIDWPRLPNFGHMWADLYRLHMHGLDGWEKTEMPLSEARKSELCHHEESVAAAEAQMYRRGLGGVTRHWGYAWLNLVQGRRPGLGVFIRGAYIWLAEAGVRLKQELQPGEVARYGGQSSVEATMPEHWELWRRSFLSISRDEQLFPADDRKLAAECYKLM